MTKKLTITALALVLSATTGCAALNTQTAKQAGQYTLNVAKLTSTITIVNPEITQAETSLAKDKSTFSKPEWQQLQSAKVSIDAARTAVNSIISGANGPQVVVSLSQLNTVYDNAKTAYKLAKPIVVSHEASLPPAQVTSFKQLNANMKQLNTEYMAVQAGQVNGAQVTQMLSNALKIAALGAQIAVASGA